MTIKDVAIDAVGSWLSRNAEQLAEEVDPYLSDVFDSEDDESEYMEALNECYKIMNKILADLGQGRIIR